jgi:hypothetical protein
MPHPRRWREFELIDLEFANGNGSIRLSHEDVGAARFDAIERLTAAFGASPLPATNRVVLEAALHTGPRVVYGLLGARFTAARTQTLNVLAGVGSAGTFRSTMKWGEKAHVGLSPPYAQAVLMGVTQTIRDLGSAAAGELVFDRAAYGDIGSSQHMYRALASVVTTLVLTHVPTDGVVMLFLTEYRRPWTEPPEPFDAE